MKSQDTLPYEFTMGLDEIIKTCGVPDLGFLTRLCVASIKASAQRVVFQFGRAGGGRNEGQKKYGYSLCTTLQQGLDRLTILPTWRTNAIALAAHIRRLCLELCGLIILFDIFPVTHLGV